MEYLETAIDLARAAGDVLNHYASRDKLVEFKGHANLVTIADKKSEELVVGGILSRYSSHSILAEESGASNQNGAEVRWIIDPLDGTTNYAHGYPFYCVSIGVEVRGEIVCGAIYDPIREEMFTAAKGEGAYCNGERLKVSGEGELQKALLITGFPYNFRDYLDSVVEQFRNFLVASQAVRRGGSAALDLCYVAAGRMDGFWELNLQPWDTAAGHLLLREAGGRVSDFSGADFSIYGNQILATNSLLHEQMLAVLARTPVRRS